MKQKDSTFAVDGQLLMVLPRTGASIKNPDVELPTLRSDVDGYYLGMRVDNNPKDNDEVALTRRVPLENLSIQEWEELKAQYSNLDLKVCQDHGISKGLEKSTIAGSSACLSDILHLTG